MSAAAALFTPPVPRPADQAMPWYRLAAAFRDNALSSWAEEAYEAPFIARRFLGRTSILLNTPEAIRYIFVDQHARFRRTPATIRVLRPILGDGLFISDGEEWRHQRRTLAPAFTPKAVGLLVHHMQAATRETVESLTAQGGGTLDLLATLQHLTLEVAGRAMFSLEMRRNGPRLRGFIAQYARTLGRPHLLDLMLPVALPTPHDLMRYVFKRRWMRFMGQIVAERQAAGHEGAPRDLFDLMLQARDPESGAAFAPGQLRDQLATMIVAGHETTAVALFWTLYLLAMVPEAQERVAAEVNGLDLYGSTGEALAAQLPYTRAVIDEAVRLYPPAFAVVRAACEEQELVGIKIAPGDLMIVAPWVLHRHRRLWRDPGSFDPSRFLAGAPAIDRFAYLPFGIGPRICIGAHFALTEATLVLAALVQAFRVEYAERFPVLPVAVVTTQPDRAPSFRLLPR